jgi:GntR family transcriptional regulator, transcriptional repressor for pyruvate dehydrogenase complex
MIIDQPAAKIDRRRVADQILEDLRGQILSGALPHGTKLPAERELAAHYGVSGPTIREAMRVLTAMGLVDSRNGSGSTVNAQSDTLMSVSISSVMQFEKAGPRDVFGLLALLYSYAAPLAVERATAEEIASLRQAAERASALDTIGQAPDELRNFHHTLAAISHHPLLAALCRAIVDIQIGLAVGHAGEDSRSSKKVLGALRKTRMDIVEALEDRDAARAVELVRAYHERTLDLLGFASRTRRSKVS